MAKPGTKKPAEARDETEAETATPASAPISPAARGPGGPSVGTVALAALALGGLLFVLQRGGSTTSTPGSDLGERWVRPEGAPRRDPPPAGTEDGDEPPAPAVVEPELLTVRVIGSFPHDRGAFTQGLEYVGGELYEGTGIRRRSTMRRVALATGEVLQSVDLPPEVFGEGITVIGDHIWQISWVEERAFLRNRGDFSVIREAEYEGEGWGLCHDDTRIVMSNGSPTLTFRDPETFAVTGTVDVTLRGRPQDMLNELECHDGLVYANVWQTDTIVRIDPATGVVTGVIDTALHPDGPEGARLLEPSEAENADVLNGIAWMPDRGHFLIGGKEWPTLFEVDFVPAAAAAAD